MNELIAYIEKRLNYFTEEVDNLYYAECNVTQSELTALRVRVHELYLLTKSQSIDSPIDLAKRVYDRTVELYETANRR